MKCIKALVALSFLLLGLVRASEVVLDNYGETVTPFDKYYIMPYYSLDGGLSLADTSNKTCPVDVIKEISEVEHGMSVMIIPVPRIGFVPTSTRLTILFADTPECAQSSSKWMLVKENEKWFVGIGGYENHPGREIREGWFIIEKYLNGYKFVFCSNSNANECGNIGIDVDENQNRRLSYSLDDGGAYEVVFQKAGGSSEPEPEPEPETPQILEITY